MYRCYYCDAPAQSNCGCAEQLPSDNEQKDYNSNSDPWGWKEEEHKINIGTGDAVC